MKVFFIASLFCLSSHCFAQPSQLEYKIKAGYLYNFTKFISWPDDESATFNLCIVGKDPFGSIISPIEKRTVKNKPIRLFHLSSINKVKNCHIIYFGESKEKVENSDLSLPGILTISSLSGTLTVNEAIQFTHRLGMIAFSINQGKVKLHVDIKALKKSGLEVSAKLLEVAEVYQGVSNE